MMTDSESLADSWRRVSHWLDRHAPASYAALLPIEVGAAGEVEAHLGHQLPPLLRAWWAVVPGTARTHAGAILPGGHRILPAGDSVRLSASWREIEARSAAMYPDAGETRDGGAAGGMSMSWRPAFLPMAEDDSGNCLFFDLRPGPLGGCVKAYDHEEGALDPPRWSSALDLLEDVATALEQESRCGPWLPMIDEEGTLLWLLDG